MIPDTCTNSNFCSIYRVLTFTVIPNKFWKKLGRVCVCVSACARACVTWNLGASFSGSAHCPIA